MSISLNIKTIEKLKKKADELKISVSCLMELIIKGVIKL